MNVSPLKSISIEEAKQKQFDLVDAICKEFSGRNFLSLGDLGVVTGYNKPETTSKIEKVIADFFNEDACTLVTGAGTGAIRNALQVLLPPSGKILVHTSPVYSTTTVSLQGLNAQLIEADFNDKNDIKKVLIENQVDLALMQYTRQKIDDHYDMEEVIKTIKETQDVPILTDDNYAVMKVSEIGVELGADVSCFSSFKLQGPEGIGIVVGKESIITKINKLNYSGGSKVQGWQAMEVLRGLVISPVMLAIQAEENNKVVSNLKSLNHPQIKNVFLANAQSKVLLVEFKEDIDEEVLIEAEQRGAAPYPVGAESKYEISPMFYRVSGTFLENDPTLKKRMIRINPMRAGSKTVIRILLESIKEVENVSR